MSAGPIQRDTFLTLVVEKSGEVNSVLTRFSRNEIRFIFVKLISSRGVSRKKFKIFREINFTGFLDANQSTNV